MRVLVTGGAGYIGSHCVQELIRQNVKVVTFDNLSTGHKSQVLSEKFIHGDIQDRDLLISSFKKFEIDTVMHLAGSAYVGESVSDPAKYYANNVQATLNLLIAMKECGVNNIIFSSTCSLYGETSQMPVTESSPIAPVNPYAFSKLVIERMFADFERAYGLHHVSLRYFNAAGADPDGLIGECHDPETHLIPLVMQAAIKRQAPLKIFGVDYPTPDGTAIRDYVHVADIASAHALALGYLQAGRPSVALNVGSSSGSSVRQVIDTVEQVSGLTVPTEDCPRRPGDPSALVSDTAMLEKTLGWRRQYDLRRIIETAWKWESSRPKAQ